MDFVAVKQFDICSFRDLKLENILCIDDERIVISDFGFATYLPEGRLLKGLEEEVWAFMVYTK